MEARLARRDAELEAWLLYDEKPAKPPSDNPKQTTPIEHVIPQRMSAEDALQAMANTSARNKQLELEVRALAGMVRLVLSVSVEKSKLTKCSIHIHSVGKSSYPSSVP